jgi:hypothetical protein
MIVDDPMDTDITSNNKKRAGGSGPSSSITHFATTNSDETV